MMKIWQANLLELIRRTVSDLPPDVVAALEAARRREAKASAGRWVLDNVLTNISLARQRAAPLCQDTGSLLFYCRVPEGLRVKSLSSAIHRAVRRATQLGYLRQNTVDTLTGTACHGNVGPGAPVIHIEPTGRARVEVRLLLKGGGSENVSRQYSLPCEALQAERDLEGVRRCALDALWQAQGTGCAPGILGIGLGGDRATGAELAKRQLLRRLPEPAPDPRLARLERRILREANQTTIGPMGLGGRTTLLGVKIASQSRLPACYFVSVAYMCWALRRQGLLLSLDGQLQRWLD